MCLVFINSFTLSCGHIWLPVSCVQVLLFKTLYCVVSYERFGFKGLKEFFFLLFLSFSYYFIVKMTKRTISTFSCCCFVSSYGTTHFMRSFFFLSFSCGCFFLLQLWVESQEEKARRLLKECFVVERKRMVIDRIILSFIEPFLSCCLELVSCIFVFLFPNTIDMCIIIRRERV